MSAYKPFLGGPSGSDSTSPQSKSTSSEGRRSDTSKSRPSVNDTCHTSITAFSTITRSEGSFHGRWKAAAVLSTGEDSLNEVRSHVSTSTKSKIVDMLSAVDRKRKQALPQAKSKDPRVISDVQTSQMILPTQNFTASSNFSKMQPRGATEREDLSELRTLFQENPARSEDRAEIPGPKSHFEWDDPSDAELSPQTRSSKLRSLQRVTRRWQAQAATQRGNSLTKTPEGIADTGLSVDSWMESAKKYAEGRRHEAVTASTDEMERKTTGDIEVDGKTKGDQGNSVASREPGKTKRRSVLHLFDDPVWSNGHGIADLIANDLYEEQNAASRSKGIDQGASGKQPSALADQRSRSENVSSALSPVAPLTPTKKAIKLEWLLGPESSPNGFRHVDWSRRGRGLSIVHRPDLALRVPSMADVRGIGSRPSKKPAHKPSKTSMLKKLKSQLFESAENSASTNIDQPRSSSATSGRRPATAQSFKAEDSHRDISDPFIDHSTQVLSTPAKVGAILPSPNQAARRFNADTASPTREAKQQADMSRGEVAPIEDAATKAEGNEVRAQASPLTPGSSNFEGMKWLYGGYPTGPEHPNWDDTVRRVKKIVQEREKREAEEARQQQKELKVHERKMKRLKAGKDVVIRSSQLGLMPRKPIDEMTEEEFEAVGGFATTPAKEASTVRKSGMFSALFTKILGTSEEKDNHVEDIRKKLERHKSLELLTAAQEGEEEYAPADRTGYEEALRILKGAEDGVVHHRDRVIDKHGSDSYHSSANRANIPTLPLPRQGSLVPRANTRGVTGLGITSDTQGGDTERQNLAQRSSYQEYTALKRRHESTANEGADLESTKDGMALSSIVEEDEESHAHGPTSSLSPMSATKKLDPDDKREDDDGGSSWCTESINSIDEIEAMAATLDDNYTAAARYSGYYSPSNFQDDCYDDAASIYSNQVNFDAMPAPLNIRVLRVKPSSTHMQPVDSNSFVPDRQTSFHARIQEVSRLQEAQISSLSHPALRSMSEDDEGIKSVECSADIQHCEAGIDSKSRSDSLDSGFGSMSDAQYEFIDEGYATGPPQQSEFQNIGLPRTPDRKTRHYSSEQHWEGGSASVEGGQYGTDMDLSALRTEVGLGPLRLVSSNSSPKHPHHPFTWNHQKVMCRDIHNPAELLPQMPPLPRSGSLKLSRMDSDYFNGSTSTNPTGESDMCQTCGSLCCRFANLLVTSKTNTSGDILEEMVRAKAQQRINMLRSYHPNGIEEYETFLTCVNCEKKVCPTCAMKCSEKLCQAVVCTTCRTGSEACPVHPVS